jgi:hypothetical protein
LFSPAQRVMDSTHVILRNYSLVVT